MQKVPWERILALAALALGAIYTWLQLMYPSEIPEIVKYGLPILATILGLWALVLFLLHSPWCHRRIGLREDGTLSWRLRLPFEWRDACRPGIVSASVATTQVRIAKVSWRRGFFKGQVTNPWEIKCKVEFLDQFSAAACFVRWGKVVQLANGKRWEWSKQTTLRPSGPASPGQIEDFAVASIPPDDNALICFGDRIKGHQNGEALIRFELVISADGKTHKDLKNYAVISDRRTFAILMEERRFEVGGS